MMAADGGAGGALDGEEGWRVVGPRFSDNLSDFATTPQSQLLVQNTNTATTTTTTVVPASRAPYGGGGAGGKSRAIRKSRGTGLPYERPSVGRSAAAGPQAASLISAASTQALAQKAQGATAWLGSGFSKIISTGATYLYSSIFRRNLPALAGSDAEAPQSNADEQVSSPTVDTDISDEEKGHDGHEEKINNHELQVVNSSALDVEALLKKKTLSRDEFQRLTDLLQSRVVSNGSEKKQQPKHAEFDVRSTRQDVHLSGGNQSEAQRWRRDLQKSREERENAVRVLTVYENGGPSSATQGGASESLDPLGSSPVEVAIAFMGGRGSRLGETSPMDPLNQRDENRMSSGPSPSFNTPQTALTKWIPPDFLIEDHLRSPPPSSLQSLGRNRTISRTPYSRPLRLPPSRERAIDGTFGTPSSPRWTPIRTPVTGGREMLKRRSTVLDEGWTSGGPIRRTRQKAVVSFTPSHLSQSRGLAFPATPLPGSSLSTLLSPMGTPSQRNAGASPTLEMNVISKMGNFYVPAQSSETARKILETLEKMTPSPKGKSLGDELAYVREKPPTALTEGMLNEQARKSMTFVDYVSPSDSREPGPSGRTADEDSPSLISRSSFKMSDSSTKVKGKGKGPLPLVENGPGGPGGSLTGQERPTIADGPLKQISARSKEPVTVMASDSDKGKGFRMSAVFEESGSEDEGRQVKSSVSTPPISTPKSPPTTSTSTIVTPSLFGAATSSSSTSAGAGLPSFATSIPVVDTSIPFSSGFTFPTRASLEGPPTPKAMSPASTSPKATSATPFFQFAQTVEQPATSGAILEGSSLVAKAELLLEHKTEFSFSSPASVVSVAQTMTKSQPILDSSNNIFKQSSPSLTASSSAMSLAGFPTFSTGGAMNTSWAQSSSKLGETLSAPTSSTFKMAAIPSNPTPFGQLFTPNSGSTQNASGPAPVPNLFSSNSGSATAAAPIFFGSDNKIGTSVSPGFGQLNAFGFKNSSSMSGPLVSPDPGASGTKDSILTSLDGERPQKRSMSSLSSSFQQDLSKRQTSPATIPNHTFTTFGSTLATSAATPAIPVTFAAGSQNTSSTQGMFAAPSFGQGSSAASQTASALPAAGGVSPYAFGAPGSSAASTSSASSSAGFGNTPSFPTFPSSAFGTASIGSTFGLAPAPAPAPAPLAFGSTATTTSFGSASTTSLFGGFASEAVSQSPPTPVFGSGFPSQSPATNSAFGASSAAFSFGPSTASSSGSAFAFGSSGSFPFAGNKGGPPSPVFGLSSSIPAFGSTTNGTMGNDVAVNDQSTFSMDDNSMAEEPSQMGGSVSPQSSIFGAQSSAGAGSFVFGAQAGVPGAAGQPLFGGFSNPTNPAGFGAAPANPFAAPQPGGSLAFDGGSFALGSGDKPQRKMFKAKRTGAKRGK